MCDLKGIVSHSIPSLFYFINLWKVVLAWKKLKINLIHTNFNKSVIIITKNVQIV